MKLRRIQQGSIEAVEMSTADLTLKVLPELGGKICSISWRDQEILAQNPSRPLRSARYGASYADYDASGFDECFPTIAPSRYPEAPLEGTELPDHGELWSIPWSCDFTDSALHLAVSGMHIPCRFEKWIDFPEPGVIRFRYALVNLSTQSFKYLWSAHPLFAPRPGMRIYLPPGTSVLVDWSKDDRLGKIFQTHPWPETRDSAGNSVDLSLIQSADLCLVDKLYTTRLSEGWCLLYDPLDGRYCAFVFPVKTVPFVGLSINMGGWPVDGPGYYNLGIEPCSGYPDSLELAIQRGVVSAVEPGKTNRWETQLHVGAAGNITSTLADISAVSRLLYAAGNRHEDKSND